MLANDMPCDMPAIYLITDETLPALDETVKKNINFAGKAPRR